MAAVDEQAELGFDVDAVGRSRDRRADRADDPIEQRIEERVLGGAGARPRGRDGLIERESREPRRAQRRVANERVAVLDCELPNRGLFQSHFEQALAEAGRIGKRVSLLLIDLDNLKSINDAMGHDAGDALLKETARRLSLMTGEGDTVARLGGDEFVVIALGPQQPSQAMELAEELLEALRDPFRYGEHYVFGLASIGVAIFPDHGADLEQLLAAADAAMYRAKGRRAGASAIRFGQEAGQTRPAPFDA